MARASEYGTGRIPQAHRHSSRGHRPGDLERLQAWYRRAGYLTMRSDGLRIEEIPGEQDAVIALTGRKPSGSAEVDRQQALQRFVDQALLRQEALRTRIVQVDEGEVNQHLRDLEQPSGRGEALERVLQDRGISRRSVRTWLHDQLIVRAFIDRRIRLFVRIPEQQIERYYQDNQQAVGEPLTDAVREQIRCLLAARQADARLAELIEELRRKATLEFPP